MPSPGGSSSTGAYRGNNGDRLYDVTHNDIDQSTFDIRCRSGACEVVLEEAIWYSWVQRFSRRIAGPDGSINESVEVDSDWYDGDHRLRIFARADNTGVDVAFSSRDL